MSYYTTFGKKLANCKVRFGGFFENVFPDR